MQPDQYHTSRDSIIRNFPVARVPVSDTGTMQYGIGARFPGADGDSSPGAGDGCLLWYVTHGCLAGPAKFNKLEGCIPARDARILLTGIIR